MNDKFSMKETISDQKKMMGMSPSKRRHGMCLMYRTLEYPDIAESIPSFIMSKQSHLLMTTINTTTKIDILDLHVLFREGYLNLGVTDKEWRTWKMFNDLNIEEIIFEENKRKYTGEIFKDRLHGFGIFEFLSRFQHYEG